MTGTVCKDLTATLPQAWGFLNWTLKTGWFTATPVCTWYGIKCGQNPDGTPHGDDAGALTGLGLELQGLRGDLTAGLAGLGDDALGQLLSVALYGNKGLTGTLDALGGMPLRSIQQLALGDCSLDGLLPAALGKLSTLTDLELYGNALTGDIPGREWSEGMPNLQLLSLNNNNLSSRAVGEGFDGFTKLQRLDLSGNQNITGVHEDLCNLPKAVFSGSPPLCPCRLDGTGINKSDVPCAAVRDNCFGSCGAAGAEQ